MLGPTRKVRPGRERTSRVRRGPTRRVRRGLGRAGRGQNVRKSPTQTGIYPY